MRWMLVVLVALLAGCASRPAALVPPEVHWGEDTCSRCHMALETARFAAAAIVEGSGEIRLFDDVGEMALWRREHPSEQWQAAWVHDYDSSTWIPLESSTLVLQTRLHTPMGTGTLAAANATAADDLIKRFGGHPIKGEAKP